MAESWATDEHTRRSMMGNRSRDTAPELAVRRLVHGAGLRYLVNARPVPHLRRTADLLFRGARLAVFIDGCYWHGCPQHFRQPASNVEYWRAKVTRTQERDAATTRALEEEGWRVRRFWEHETPSDVARLIAETIDLRR